MLQRRGNKVDLYNQGDINVGEILIALDVNELHFVSENKQIIKTIAENDIANNLDTDDDKKVLSARQGKELKDMIIFLML